MPPPKVDEATIRRLMGDQADDILKKPKTPGRRGMNKTEARFFQDLLIEKTRGIWVSVAFESVRLKVLDIDTDGNHKGQSWYKPDFTCVRPDETVAYFEVKGYEYKAEMLRFKAAVHAHPHHDFFLVRWVDQFNGFGREHFRGKVS